LKKPTEVETKVTRFYKIPLCDHRKLIKPADVVNRFEVCQKVLDQSQSAMLVLFFKSILHCCPDKPMRIDPFGSIGAKPRLEG
jgi:hypothetical protein